MDFPFRGSLSGTVSAMGVYCCFLFEAWLKARRTWVHFLCRKAVKYEYIMRNVYV